MDERLRTQVAVEALQDKIDESEDKESILGGDILNPTTGAQRGTLKFSLTGYSCCCCVSGR
jgi:hypothetical protein